MKLISVERVLEIYRVSDEELVLEIPLDFSVELLKEIVAVKENDDLLYLPYELNSEQLNKLIALIKEPLKPDFTTFYYVLECHGIYEKSN